MTISRSHIAYGAKDDIRGAIAAKKIPKNCLIVTKITDPYEQAELFYYDKEKNLRALSTKEVFSSLEAATAWVNSYYCVGRQIVVLVDDEWHLYTVDAENNLVLRDGSDKVADIAPEDPSIHVGGTSTSPTISVVIDPVLANGLDIGEDGILLMPATQQTAGAISAADKTKLDGIEAGAEVNTIRDIGTGEAEGTISVNGVDVRVKGLGSAAFTDSNAYQPMGTGMNYAVVEELPAVGRTDTIYLKANKGEENNVFDEFLYVNGVFELVGTTKTDLSDYYTRGEADRKINSVVTEALIPKANSADLAKVATTGSYKDLSDKPKFPIIVNCKQKSDGYYYAETPFGTAKSLLKQGLQVAIYWPPTNMVFQCTIYSDSSNVMYLGVMDNTTYRFLQWTGRNDRVEEYSKATFISKEYLQLYYTKEEVDDMFAQIEEDEITRMWGV